MSLTEFTLLRDCSSKRYVRFSKIVSSFREVNTSLTKIFVDFIELDLYLEGLNIF